MEVDLKSDAEDQVLDCSGQLESIICAEQEESLYLSCESDVSMEEGKIGSKMQPQWLNALLRK